MSVLRAIELLAEPPTGTLPVGSDMKINDTLIVDTSNIEAFKVGVGATDTLIVDTINGRVSIGPNTTPAFTLEASGTDGVPFTGSIIRSSAAGSVSAINIENLSTTAGSGPILRFSSGSSGTTVGAIALDRESSNNGALVFYTESSDTVDERMRINSTGVVTMANTTDSTTSGTGGLVLSGGLGVAKNITADRIGGVYYADTIALIVSQLGVMTSGDKLVIAPGTYAVASDLVIPSGCVVEGAGRGTLFTRTDDDVFVLAASTVDVSISGVRFEGTQTGGTAVALVRLGSSCTDIVISDCEISNDGASANDGRLFSNTGTTGCSRIFIRNCICDTNRLVVELDTTTDSRISDCTFIGGSEETSDFFILDTCSDCVVSNCHFDDMQARILVTAGVRVKFESCNVTMNAAGDYGLRMDGASDWVTVSNCIFTGSATTAILASVNAGNNHHISNNVFHDCTATDVIHSSRPNAVIVGNVIENGSGAGIRILGSNATIVGNEVTGCVSGLFVDNSATDCNVVGNNFHANTTEINLEATSSQTNRYLGNLADDTDSQTVASATDISLSPASSVFDITGTTTIDTILAGYDGRIVVLRFSTIVTLRHNITGTFGKILLGGASDLTTVANDTVSLISDGTNWAQVGSTGGSSNLIDDDSAEAFLVRQDLDAGDVFTVSTLDPPAAFGSTGQFGTVSIGGDLRFGGTGTTGEGADSIFKYIQIDAATDQWIHLGLLSEGSTDENGFCEVELTRGSDRTANNPSGTVMSLSVRGGILSGQFKHTGSLGDTSADRSRFVVFQKVIDVTAVSGANPAELTSTAHGLTSGDTVILSGFTTVADINGSQTVTVTGVNTFTVPVDTTTSVTDGVGIATTEDFNLFFLGAALSDSGIRVNMQYGAVFTWDDEGTITAGGYAGVPATNGPDGSVSGFTTTWTEAFTTAAVPNWEERVGIVTAGSSMNLIGAAPRLLIADTTETDSGIKFADNDDISGQHYELLYNSADESIRFRSDTVDNVLSMNAAGSLGVGVAASGTGPGVITFSNEILGPSDGTPTDATYTFSGDQGTGMYSDTASTLQFTTGGTLQMTINSSGSVILSNELELPQDGTVSDPSITFTGDTNTGIFSDATANLKITTGGVLRVHIDEEGHFGIGIDPTTRFGLYMNVDITDANPIGQLWTGEYTASAASQTIWGTQFGINTSDNYTFAGGSNSSAARARFVPMTVAGTGTVTRASTLEIIGAPTTTGPTLTDIYAIYVDSGDSIFGGDIGIGMTSGDPTDTLDVNGTANISGNVVLSTDTSALTTIGSRFSITSGAHQSIVSAVAIQPDYTNGGTFGVGVLMAPKITTSTNDNIYGVWIEPELNNGGGASTGELMSSLRIVPPITDGSSWTEAATLYINGAPTSGDTNYAIQALTGDVAFGGDLRVGSIGNPSDTLDVDGTANISGDLTVGGITGGTMFFDESDTTLTLDSNVSLTVIKLVTDGTHDLQLATGGDYSAIGGTGDIQFHADSDLNTGNPSGGMMKISSEGIHIVSATVGTITNASDLLDVDGSANISTTLAVGGNADFEGTLMLGSDAVTNDNVTLQIDRDFQISGAGVNGVTAEIRNSIITTASAAGTHTDIANLYVLGPTITADTATVTNSATVMITAAPSGTGISGTDNHALMVKAGSSKFVGDVIVTGGELGEDNDVTVDWSSGFTTTVQSNLRLRLVGKLVYFHLEGATGTSNASLFEDLAIVPAGLRPEFDVQLHCIVEDSGVKQSGYIEFQTTGDIHVGSGPSVADGGGGFTASGTKAIRGVSGSWIIA